MPDVTHILSKIEAGDRQASSELLPLVYEELRRLATARMAGERADHMLQATALVHEAYMRLVDADLVQNWDSRGHFFSAAAEAMRRILIEAARSRNTEKRGGAYVQIPIGDPAEDTITQHQDLLLDLDEKLVQLEQEDPEISELVKLRLYAGLSIQEAGQALGMSRKTTYDNWEYVRSWFTVQMPDATS